MFERLWQVVRYTPHVERQTLAKFNVRWLHFFLWKRQNVLKLDLIWINTMRCRKYRAQLKENKINKKSLKVWTKKSQYK